MRENLTVSIFIKAPPDLVWQGLTDPRLVKKYFYGTNLDSSWQQGSPIFFRGEWDGKPYEDKGTILSITPGRHVAYSYWSSLSPLPDQPENYQTIAYDLSMQLGGTELTVTDQVLPENKERAQTSWRMVLEGLKNLLENSGSTEN